MKKYILILMLAAGTQLFASTHPLRVYNYSAYYFNYQMIAYPLDGFCAAWPRLSTETATMDVIPLAPGGSHIYNVPGAPGLPFNTFPSWIYASSPSTSTIITGAAAYSGFGNTHRWGKCKFSITSAPVGGTDYGSGNVGPCGDVMSVTMPGGTTTWLATSGGVVVTLT